MRLRRIARTPHHTYVSAYASTFIAHTSYVRVMIQQVYNDTITIRSGTACAVCLTFPNPNACLGHVARFACVAAPWTGPITLTPTRRTPRAPPVMTSLAAGHSFETHSTSSLTTTSTVLPSPCQLVPRNASPPPQSGIRRTLGRRGQSGHASSYRLGNPPRPRRRRRRMPAQE